MAAVLRAGPYLNPVTPPQRNRVWWDWQARDCLVRCNVITRRDLRRPDRQSSMKILRRHLTDQGGGLSRTEQRHVQRVVQRRRAYGEIVRGQDGAAWNIAS